MMDSAQDNSGEHSSLKYLPFRKIVHIGGVVVPIIAVYIGKNYAIGLALYFLFIFLFIEILKAKVQIPAVFRFLWKEKELKGFAIDPFLYYASILMLLLMSFYFDDGICYASIVILTIGDGISTVVGLHGKIYFRDTKKTIEGAAAGTIAAAVIAFPFVGGLAFVGSAIGMIAEVTSKRFDNIAVPFAAFVSMLITQAIIG